MENTPFKMVIKKHVDQAETIFTTMSGPLVNNPLEKWLGVIRRGSYQAADEYRMWAYEPVSDLWTDIYPESDYIIDWSRY